MILHIAAKNNWDYERVSKDVLGLLNAQGNAAEYSAVTSINRAQDLKGLHQPHILITDGFSLRRDYHELEQSFTIISAKVMTYGEFKAQNNYSEPQCQGTHQYT